MVYVEPDAEPPDDEPPDDEPPVDELLDVPTVEEAQPATAAAVSAAAERAVSRIGHPGLIWPLFPRAAVGVRSLSDAHIQALMGGSPLMVAAQAAA
jgi:hypothetical protein